MKKLLTVPVLGTILVILSLCSIYIGVKSLSISDGWDLTKSQFNILFSSRLPRTISIIIAGAGLSVCGLVMQRLTRNKFVSPTTAGTMEWAKLGVVVALISFNAAPLLLQLLIASVLAVFGSLLFVWLLRAVRFKHEIFIPLIGLMLGQIVNGLTTFLGVEFQIMQSVNSWLQGNFAIVTSHRYELLFLVLPCLFLIFRYAHHFTLVGLGEEFAQNLGLRAEAVTHLGLVLVSVITAVVVTVAGTLPFLGLLVPNLISLTKGDNLPHILPLTALLGAVLVMVCDILGRLIIYPYEISIGLIMGVFGSASFLLMLFYISSSERHRL
ncbi:ABC transporter permease [Streptococcus sp. H49]|uniref:ABC transporter permease n=1 Tax=Streptococcus huangxiaojuni TaxID=3237239 RepID=UPI0034A35DCD